MDRRVLVQVLATRRVTVSPSFHRSVGAGTEPFTVNAIFGDPVNGVLALGE